MCFVIWVNRTGEVVCMSIDVVVITLISAIISGVLATIITVVINHKMEMKKIKRGLVDDIFGYRYQLSAGYRDANKSEITRALNRIPIVFENSEKVLKAYDDLYDAATTSLTPEIRHQKMEDKLITLYKEMCKASGIEVANWNDSRIKNIFNVS